MTGFNHDLCCPKATAPTTVPNRFFTCYFGNANIRKKLFSKTKFGIFHFSNYLFVCLFYAYFQLEVLAEVRTL